MKQTRNSPVDRIAGGNHHAAILEKPGHLIKTKTSHGIGTRDCTGKKDRGGGKPDNSRHPPPSACLATLHMHSRYGIQPRHPTVFRDYPLVFFLATSI